MHKKSKASILALLQKTLVLQLNEHTGLEKINLRKKILKRRKFIKDATKAGLGLIASNELMSSCISQNIHKNYTKVIILGGGISGLQAGNILHKKNIDFKLFEATRNLGGRIFTLYDAVGPGIISEMGGEFIDSNHSDMIDLTKEFGLSLLDINNHISTNKLIKDSYFFNGKHFTEEEVIAVFSSFTKEILNDIKTIELGNEDTLLSFDKISITEYLKSKKLNGWIFDLLSNAFTAEYGVDASIQSSLNLLTMIDTNTNNGLRLYGDSDERYKIKGGNKKLIDKMAEKINSKIYLNNSCTDISMKDDLYELEFSNKEKWYCQYLIITIPFTALKKINLNLNIPDNKRNVIQNLNYGTNSKICLGFSKSPWLEKGRSGYLFSKNIQNGWDTNIYNDNNHSFAYTIFLGGEPGKILSDDQTEKYLNDLDQVFNGCRNVFTSKKLIFNWTTSSLANGSYAVYKVGEWTSYAGLESIPVGNMFFAGEHCSEDFRGYMNGGAETGRKAAEEIIKRIDIS